MATAMCSVRQLQEYYEQDGRRYVSEAAERLEDYRFACIVKEVRRQAGCLGCRRLRVVDAGAGWGQLATGLAEDGHQVTALDWAHSRLERFAARARELGIVQVAAPLEQSGLPDAYADAVVCSEVLEHLFDPALALREFSRITGEHGFLVVTVPHAEILRGVRCPGGAVVFHPHGHLHSFALEDLRALLHSCGYALVHHRVIANRFVAPLLRRGWVNGTLACAMDRFHPPQRGRGWLLLVARKTHS
jgi:SAM-dependent methyltransferase